MRREVRRAFEQAPESHRAESFKADLQATKQTLCELVRAKHVELFLGAGTLANDVIGAQLSLRGERGLVLSNGEFGTRLIDQARRFRLDFEAIELSWGAPLNLALVQKKLASVSPPAWLWCVHCETSTGVLNDLAALRELCGEYGVKLCLDCISSIGTVPVNLTGVYFASCSSGKGLRSYPGVSMVFHNHDAPAAEGGVPRYLDLGWPCAAGRHSFHLSSSNLLHALHAAVKRVDWERRFADTAADSSWLRPKLAEIGFELIGNGTKTSPAVAPCVAAGNEFVEDRRPDGKSGLSTELQQRVSAPTELDSNLSDGRMHT